MNNSPDDQEKQLLRYVREGPIKTDLHRFEDILTIPRELEGQLQLWDDEIEICDQAICVGKALDAIIHTHEELLAQFSRMTDLRDRFYHAPDKYMVVQVYYCDRALDGLLSSIVRVRKQIRALYDELKTLCAACMNVRNSAQKAYQVFDDTIRMRAMSDPSIRECVEKAKLKAAVLKELGNRISSIAHGGDSTFKYLNKSWTCQDVDQTAGPNTSENAKEAPPTKHVRVASKGKATCSRGNPSESQEGAPAGDEESQKTPNEVPETPESDRIEALAKTQRSSPKKKPSLSHSQKRRLETERERRVVVAKTLELDTPRRNMGSPDARSSMQAIVRNPAIQEEEKERHEQEHLIQPSAQSRDLVANRTEEQCPVVTEQGHALVKKDCNEEGDNLRTKKSDSPRNESSIEQPMSLSV